MDYERITKMLDKTFAWSVARTFSREEAEELTQEIMFQVFVALFKAVAADWLRRGRINISNGAVCDALIMM